MLSKHFALDRLLHLPLQPGLLCFCFPFANVSLAASPHASIPVEYNGGTDRESFRTSAVAPAAYVPAVFTPDVRSAQIPLLFLNQISFFFFFQNVVSFRNANLELLPETIFVPPVYKPLSSYISIYC